MSVEGAPELFSRTFAIVLETEMIALHRVISGPSRPSMVETPNRGRALHSKPSPAIERVQAIKAGTGSAEICSHNLRRRFGGFL